MTALSLSATGLGSRTTPSEVHAGERVLAAGRVFFAAFLLLAFYLVPQDVSLRVSLVHTLTVAYLLYSLLVWILLDMRGDCSRGFRLGLHAIDLLWPAVVFPLTSGTGIDSIVLFFFVLMAAAYRWGFREALLTATISALLEGAVSVYVAQLRWMPPQYNPDPKGLIQNAALLLCVGGLLGGIEEKESRLRARRVAIAHIVRQATQEVGLRAALEGVIGSVQKLFGASGAAVAVRQSCSGRAFRWEAERHRGTGEPALRLTELEAPQQDRYLFSDPGSAWWVKHTSSCETPLKLLALHGCESRSSGNLLDGLRQSAVTWQPFHAVASVGFTLGEGDKWSGRLLLFDPSVGGNPRSKLRFLQDVVGEVAPAVYVLYRLRCLSARSGSRERARIAREVHDGVVQTLIALDLKLDTLRCNVMNASEGLQDARQQLHQEMLNVRELMERIKPLDLSPSQLSAFIADLVLRFQRDTGIIAHFSAHTNGAALPPHAAREVIRIVQEALANVRKHSGAHRVVVHLSSEPGVWRLTIEDDGRGFEFSGKLLHAEVDAGYKGPLTLAERVRSIGGQLAVESFPARGARLEILLPLSRNGF